MEPFELKKYVEKYLDIAARRKWWIIIPFLLTLLVGLTYALTAPRIYMGETLILVIPQKVPENYVRSIVRMDMEERLRTIKQQVTSRTNLEKIIDQYQLLNSPSGRKMVIQEKVDSFRKRIGINVARGTAFTISYIDKDPKKAKDVTNALASNFITENVKIREEQAIGTSRFLANELESVKKRLEEKEESLTRYPIQEVEYEVIPDSNIKVVKSESQVAAQGGAPCVIIVDDDENILLKGYNLTDQNHNLGGA